MNTSYLDIGKTTHTVCLDEEMLGQQMKKKVEPYLEQTREEGHRNSLYYELYPKQDSLGTIVISHGFGEACMKYHELIYYFHRQGYQVAIQDYRGHGKSLRDVEDKNIVHIDDFSRYLEDFHDFIQSEVIPRADNKPLYLYAHSMGGCIGVLYLETYPDDFSKAVLNAPMLGVQLGKWPMWLGKFICNFEILKGKGKKMLFVLPEFQPDEPFSDSAASSEARHAYYHEIRKKDVDYQTSCASYCWGIAAERAGRLALNPKRMQKIKIPVTLFQAEEDTLVTAKEHAVFINGIPDGHFIIVPKTRHEISRAGNSVLSRYLDLIFEFYRD